MLSFPLLLEKLKAETKAENKNDLYGFSSSTPSKFSAFSIKSFFYELDPFKNSDLTKSPSTQKSKTSIFNQSLVCYVKEVYNRRDYNELISQDGTHIVEFLELSSELNLDIKSLYTCIRLFYNKIKECELMDDTVIIQILKPLPFLLEKYFDAEKPAKPSQNSLSKKIEKILLSKFTDHLPEFQANPPVFLEQLAQEISSTTKKEFGHVEQAKEESVTTERLRQIVIRFLEIAISKIVWDKNAYEGIWDSAITIASNIELLAEHGIIDHADDCDDLLWSITHRFCFFLDLVGSNLPLTFYEHIESDLNSKVVAFLEAEEQDDGIKTKKAFIAEALVKAKAKAIAFEKKGIISDQIL
jgi:hypothetical protein